MASRDNSSRRVPLRTAMLLVAVSVLVAVPTAVLAAHVFDDVPDSNTFHDDIAWLADNEVTLGCVPDGSLYCPSEAVTRQQMAGFMRRLVGDVWSRRVPGRGLQQRVSTSRRTRWSSSGAVTVDAKGPSDVVLTAHGYLEKPASAHSPLPR